MTFCLSKEERKENWLDSVEYWIEEFRLISECLEDKWYPKYNGIQSKICALCVAHVDADNSLLCEDCCITRFNSDISSCRDTPNYDWEMHKENHGTPRADTRTCGYCRRLVTNEIMFLENIRKLVIKEVPEGRRTNEMKKALENETEETVECNECYESWTVKGIWNGNRFLISDGEDETCPNCSEQFYTVLNS